MLIFLRDGRVVNTHLEAAAIYLTPKEKGHVAAMSAEARVYASVPSDQDHSWVDEWLDGVRERGDQIAKEMGHDD